MRSFGTDPEFMLTKNESIFSAIGIIQGDIENRILIRGHEFYYDNVLAECAVKPAHSREEAVENIRECLQIYANMANPFRLDTIASAFYDSSQLDHPDAVRVGCAPDMCAYEMKQMHPPRHLIKNGNLRTCGGHIHIGDDILTTDGIDPIITVLMLDLFLGLPSLWLDKDPTSAIRREIYGQAGRFRTKDYGIEYRSLGNFWLQSPKLVELIYDLTEFTVDFVASGKANDHWQFNEEQYYELENPGDALTCLSYDANLLKNGINQGSKSELESLYTFSKSLMPKRITKQISVLENTEIRDLYENWNLTIS